MVLLCQQHVVYHLEAEPLRLLDHVHRTRTPRTEAPHTEDPREKYQGQKPLDPKNLPQDKSPPSCPYKNHKSVSLAMYVKSLQLKLKHF